MSIPEKVLQLAESLNTHMPLGPEEQRFVHPDWTLWLGSSNDHPAFTVVQRMLFRPEDVAAKVGEIRAFLAEKKRPRSHWEVGPSATPPDLVERLLALGMTRYEEPISTGMVLRRPLPRTETAVTARRAETVDDYYDAFVVLNRVFGERVETPEQRRERAEREHARRNEGTRGVYVATLDGEVVAAASALFAEDAVVLCGSGTLPHARGRGAYRALVAARYEDAVKRGTPTLVIQAGEMSRPILERLGFEAVAVVQILLDEGGSGGEARNRAEGP